MPSKNQGELLSQVVQAIKDNASTDFNKTRGADHRQLEVNIIDTMFALYAELQQAMRALYLATREVDDIAERDALALPPTDPELEAGEIVLVKDASADPDITAGWALYRYNANGTWLLLQKQEQVALALTAANISFSPAGTIYNTTAVNVDLVLRQISDILSTLLGNNAAPSASGERISKKYDGANFTPGRVYAHERSSNTKVLANYNVGDDQTVTGFALTSEELVKEGFVSGLTALGFDPNTNYYLSISQPGVLVKNTDPNDIGPLILSVMGGGVGMVYDDGKQVVPATNPGGTGANLATDGQFAAGDSLTAGKPSQIRSLAQDLIEIDVDTPADAPDLTVTGGRSLLSTIVNWTIGKLKSLGTSISTLTTALSSKADLVAGKVPLSQLPDAILGQVHYQGNYNASTGNVASGTGSGSALPAAASGNMGWYYIVTVAGTQFSKDFGVGDWIISTGTAWEKVDNTDAVMTVFGRTGPVTAQSGDYNASQITHTPSGNISATTVQGAISELDTEKVGKLTDKADWEDIEAQEPNKFPDALAVGLFAENYVLPEAFAADALRMLNRLKGNSVNATYNSTNKTITLPAFDDSEVNFIAVDMTGFAAGTYDVEKFAGGTSNRGFFLSIFQLGGGIVLNFTTPSGNNLGGITGLGTEGKLRDGEARFMFRQSSSYILTYKVNNLDVSTIGGSLPSFAGNALKYARVNAGATAIEYVDLPVSSGSSIKQTYTQNAHGFAVGESLYYTGSDWAKARADSMSTAKVRGVIEAVTTNTFTVVFSGEITLSGLMAGSDYYLSAATAGLLSTTEPSTTGEIIQFVMFAISTTKAIVQIQRADYVY